MSRDLDVEDDVRSVSSRRRGGKEDALGRFEAAGFDERQPSIGVTRGIQMG